VEGETPRIDEQGRIILDYPVRPRHRYGYDSAPHQKLYELINRHREAYRDALERMPAHEDHFRQIPAEPPAPGAADWRCGWLGGLDLVALYSLLCELNPDSYVEVGSGCSTRFARRAVRDHGLATRIVSIDPEPRDAVDQICDIALRQRLEDIDLRVFYELGPQDIVFIDGSHRCFTGSDVTAFFLDVLPNLAAGVYVGFHDIYLPNDYPPEWTEYFFNEQYLLGVHLLSGGKSEIVLATSFISEDPELSEILAPLWKRLSIERLETAGSTFWIKTG